MDNKVTQLNASKKLSALDRARACNAGLDHHRDQLARLMTDTKWIIPNVVSTGTSTLFCAGAGSGKTLYILWSILNAIRTGEIDPGTVYYWNEDDHFVGFKEKADIAAEYGFNMIGTSNTGGDLITKPEDVNKIMSEMAATGEAAGQIFILDTLKKFANPLDKNRFPVWVANCTRPFVLAGGTIIALAHVNKNKDVDGRPVFAGVEDLKDDFDQMYLGDARNHASEPMQKVVWLKEKGRGPVKASWEVEFQQFGEGSEITYQDLLDCVRVQEHDQRKDWAKINRENFDRRWKPVKRLIDVVLSDGAPMNQKDLIDAVRAAESEHSEIEVTKTIKALAHVDYLGFEKGEHNAFVYSINGNYNPDSFEWADLDRQYTKPKGRKSSGGK